MDALPPADNNTLPKILRYNAYYRADIIAWREKEFGIWQQWTWKEVYQAVCEYASGYQQIGIKRGDRVAIIGGNRPQSYFTIVALQAISAVPVPLYHDAVAEELAWVLDFAEITSALVENQEQCDKVLHARAANPRIAHIIYDDPKGMAGYDAGTTICSLEHVQRLGKLELVQTPNIIKEAIDRTNVDDHAIIPFTSGTTGRAKGVLLSHGNVIATSKMAVEFDSLGAQDSVMSYLPVAWVGDFIFSLCMSAIGGFSVNCPESPETFLHDMNEIGPTLFFAPPRVLEALHARVMVRMSEASALKRRLFHWGIGVAQKTGVRVLDKQPIGLGERLEFMLARALIIDPLRSQMGLSRTRVAYTGGEAIGLEIFKFYRGIGLNLKQLYGATECSVFATMQPDDAVRLQTVGKPAPGVQVRLDASGEVLVAGPGVFKGYLKNDQASAEALVDGQWLRTGDAGVFDANDHLRIIDRAKDVGKLQDGSLFAPRYIENALKYSSFINEAVAVGNGREYVAAMINIEPDIVGTWAEQNKVPYSSYRDLTLSEDVISLISKEIAEINNRLAEDKAMSNCIIRRFVILHKALDADDGELTRTRKLRRGIIEERYSAVLEAMFEAGTLSVECSAPVTFEDGSSGNTTANLSVRTVGKELTNA